MGDRLCPGCRSLDGEHTFDRGCTLTEDDTKARDPGCKCHWEEGDSPCPVHGEEEELSNG